MKYDAIGFTPGVDGTRLFWGVRGEGLPIVLCDGIGCDGWAWGQIQPALAARHRIVHWHYRGHGRSGPPVDRTRLDMTTNARDALCVLDALGIEKAIFMGHSMGVQVCLEIARQAPERVAGLMLICGSYGRVTKTFHGSDTLEVALPAVRALVERYGGLVRSVWSRIPTKMSYQLSRLSGEIDGLALSEAEFVGYIEHLRTMDPDLFLSMLDKAGEHTAEDALESIAAPTLVVAGEFDSFTPAELSTHMAERIPGAELFVVRGGTHSAPVEQPTTVLLRIEKFLQERFGSAPGNAA